MSLLIRRKKKAEVQQQEVAPVQEQSLLDEARSYDDPTPEFSAVDVMTPDVEEPTAEEAARLGQQFVEGGKDFLRDTAVGGLLIMQLAADRKNWDRAEQQERQMPFSSYTAVEKGLFGDYLKEQKINLRDLDPKIQEEVRIGWMQNRSKRMQEQIKTRSDQVQEIFKANPALLQDQTFLEKLVRTTPQVFAQAMLSMASGGTLSMPTMGLMIVGSSYQNSIADGATHEDALNNAMLNAIIQAPMEQIGISKATKWFKPKQAIVKKLKAIIEGGLGEGLTEFIQQYPDAWTNFMAKNPDAGMLEAFGKILTYDTFKEALESGTIGAIMGGGIATAGQAVRGAQDEQAPVETEPTDIEDTTLIAEEAGASEAELAQEPATYVKESVGVTKKGKNKKAQVTKYQEAPPTPGAEQGIPVSDERALVPIADRAGFDPEVGVTTDGVPVNPQIAEQFAQGVIQPKEVIGEAALVQRQMQREKGMQEARQQVLKDREAKKVLSEFEKRTDAEKAVIIERSKNVATNEDMMQLIDDVAAGKVKPPLYTIILQLIPVEPLMKRLGGISYPSQLA